MRTWLINNISTLIIGLILIIAVIIVLLIMIRNKKNGRSSCGGNCQGCPYSQDSCNKNGRKKISTE